MGHNQWGCFDLIMCELDAHKYGLHGSFTVIFYIFKTLNSVFESSTCLYNSFCVYSDFQHALVLEPQNKAASLAEKRLRKLMS